MGILNKIKQNDETPVAATTEVRAKQHTRSVLVRPIVTEKSSLLMASNQYVFEVLPSANKIMVSHAIKEKYGIEPASVRMVLVKGKTRVRGRITGVQRGWKKAIVALPAGKSISVTEGA